MNMLRVVLLMVWILQVFMFTACSQKKEIKNTSYASHKATMRVYNVMGKRYRPTYVEEGNVMHGVSSWYGPNFHGKLTSNGEKYDMYARTAAHKTWPMNTMVKVSNKDNGKSTIVRINDRGPFVSGRIIDCSYTAGKEIGLDKTGIANVVIEVVGFAGKINRTSTMKPSLKPTQKMRVQLSNFGVQVGSFSKLLGAKNFKSNYTGMYNKYNPIIKTFTTINGTALYRVWLMGFGSEEEARDFKNNNDLAGAFIVRN
jgi:rare lipoprotein A